jgi:hypothetical protein
MDTRRVFEPHTWDGAIDFTDFNFADEEAKRFGEGRCGQCGGLFVVGREGALIEHPERLERDFAGGEQKFKARSLYLCAWCVDQEGFDPYDPEAWRPMFQYGRC